MIAVDDLIDVVRYRHAFGVEIQTPAIDALMSRGVAFSNSFAPVTLCAPSRAAILTGQSPFATEVHHNVGAILEDQVPVAATLYGAAHAAGFYTAASGKTFHAQDSASMQAYLTPVLDEAQWGRGFRSSGNDLPGAFGDAPVAEQWMTDSMTAKWAVDFLSDPPADEAFFLSVGIGKPHLSWDVPKAYYDLYDLDDIEVPEIDGVGFEDLPDFARNLIVESENIHGRVLSADLWAEMVRAYLAAVSYADAQIGRVLDAISDAELWGETTVALWSDHGFHLGDREVWKKFTLWEEAASVPFIIVDPDVGRAGETIETPVSMLDLWPTLAGLVGFSGPENAGGVDLSPLLLGAQSELAREGVITSSYGSLSVRTADWRYILYNSGEEELFRVDQDQVYGRDVSQNASLSDVMDQMRALLRQEASSYGVEVAEANASEFGSSQDEVFVVIGDGRASGLGGDDAYYVTGDGQVVERAGGGHDKVFVSSDRDFTLFDHVEDAVLAAKSRGDFIGNDLDNQMWANGSPNRIRGLMGNDTILGGSGSDTINGGGGNDALFGENSRDRLTGGDGNDTLDGGDDSDKLYGDAGRDLLRGGTMNDRLYGGLQGDWLYGEVGNDRIYGEDGYDHLFGGERDDVLDGGRGTDHLDGGIGHDTLIGGGGADTLQGGDGKDTLNGDDGRDLLVGGTRSDVLYGGAQGDRLYGETGSDRLYGGDGSDRLYGGGQQDVLDGGRGLDNLYAGRGDDTLRGDAGNDRLFGGDGRDTLNGGDGDDTLDGGESNDWMNGGNGEDVFIFGAGRDRIFGFENNIDTIVLDDALWGGGLTEAQVLQVYGRDTGADIVLDFGEAELTIRNFADLSDLTNDIDIV